LGGRSGTKDPVRHHKERRKSKKHSHKGGRQESPDDLRKGRKNWRGRDKCANEKESLSSKKSGVRHSAKKERTFNRIVVSRSLGKKCSERIMASNHENGEKKKG